MTTTEIRPATQQPWPSRREREGIRPRGRHAAPAVAPVPAARVVVDPELTTRLPVIAPRPASVPAPRPAPAAFRPSTPSVRPPRPAVGSRLGADLGHRTDGRIRSPHNGAGLAALCLGLVGLPFALTPVTSFLAAGLGVLALTFGVAGWSRARARTATNRGSAVTGALFGLVALLLGALGTIAFFQNPAQVVYDVDTLTSSIHSIGE